MNLLFSKLWGYVAAAVTAVLGILVALLMYSENRREAAERAAAEARREAAVAARQQRHDSTVAKAERTAVDEGAASVKVAVERAKGGNRDHFEQP